MRRSYASFVLLALTSVAAGCGNRPAALQITSNGPSLQAARNALNEGEAGTALAIARGILTSQPRNVPALAQAGDAEAVLGDRLAATASFRKALALSPHDMHAQLGLGKLQIRDDLPGAEASFRAVLATAPQDPLALNDLGYVLDLQERHTEAQACYRTAIEADPDRMSTRVNLALSLALSGQPERAEQMFRDIAANGSASRKVRLDFAVAQVLAGHERDAAETLGSDLSPSETQSAIDGIAQLRPAPSPAVKPAHGGFAQAGHAQTGLAQAGQY